MTRLSALLAATTASVVTALGLGHIAVGQELDPCATPTPTPTPSATPAPTATPAPSLSYDIATTGQFNGGLNTNNGSISNISAPADPDLTMRAAVTKSGASYARGIIDNIGLKDGQSFSVAESVVFKDTGRYVSVARFDNYAAYGSDGSIFGVERWASDNKLHVVSGKYDGTTLVSLAGPVVSPNVKYNLRLEGKLSPSGGGYTRLYVNDALVASSAAPNNISGRAFSKLRAGVVAVGASPVSVDFGGLKLRVFP